MKVLKVIIALIVSFLLLCTQGLLMAAFVCDRSFDSESVTKAIRQTNFTQQLYEQALSTSDQAGNKKAQEVLKQAFATDTATRFMGEYASSAIDSVLYGKQVNQITKKDLSRLTSEGLDELSKQSGVEIPASQRKKAMDYVNANGSSIVSEINNTLPVLQEEALSDSSDMAAIYQVQTFLGAPVRAALIVVCLILGILLIALFMRSKLGFIWWAAVSFILGAVFLLLGTSSSMLRSYIQESGEGTAFSALMTDMFSRGFTSVGVAALVLTLLLVAICILSRKISKRRATH